ncbi:MAG: xanthine dehydrogenase family protein, partial [Longimicrobiales bacterium]|nr:xanthine dehydrogenase family protein [Longimicrobiales bacterium]
MAKLIGTDIAPQDLRAKITGRAKYAEDFRVDGMVFAKLLLSPMPHARVRSIDTARALALPGVLGILTADEVPQPELPGEACLTNEPRYEGEPILALAAVDETTAAEAIELIRLDLEPLPFVLDPLESLRPGGPDAWTEGNVLVEDAMKSLKWAGADFSTVAQGLLPMGEVTAEWAVGDVEAGFAQADHVLDETVVHQTQTHHPLEPRSTLAYWQNGKLFAHVSVQSAARARAALADALGLQLDDVVVIAEYCGGGFGSKITGNPIMQVAPLFSKKLGRPVMLRITRYEETYVGRSRPGFQARAKIGFRRDGRITALDLFIVEDHGSYGGGGDFGTAGNLAHLMYQPETMRLRAVPVFTNTPPRSAQRGPGGVQIVAIMEPLMDKAARELGMDRLALRRVNAPRQGATFGPRATALTSIHIHEALDLGEKLFGWEEKKAWSGRRDGSRVTGVGIGVSPYTAGSIGYDGLLLIRPDGKLYVHQGVGNLGTQSVMDTARAAADALGVGWDQVEVVWGDTGKGLPWSSSQGGSQTTHAHTRANHAAGLDARRKIQEVAAQTLGGAPASYDVDGGRVFQRGNRSRGMSFAQVAERAIELGGRFDGHTLPEDIHAMTVGAATALTGQGLMGVAKDNFGREGSTYSWVVGFAVVEVDVETGAVAVKEYTGVADCGTILHPRSLGAQILGGSIQGMGVALSQRWVYDPKWGTAFAKRLYTARPPSILDVPMDMKWAAVEIPDPATPIGAKGIGEP